MDNENESKNSEYQNREIYKYVNRQVKDCQRKSLGLIKEIFKKFSLEHDFIENLSQIVYQEIIADQLPLLNSNHITEKS